jgi:hypothetical protein
MDLELLLKNHMDDSKRLKLYPSKRKLKTAVLFYIAERFDAHIQYTEKEINHIISDICLFDDTSLIRRELVDYGFLKRTTDGSVYRLSQDPPVPSDFDFFK